MGRPARDETSALVTLSCQDTPRIRRMLLRWNVLSRLSCPAYVVLVSLPYSNVDCHLCFHRQLGACPNSSRETSQSLSCLPNPLVDICVQVEVVSDGVDEVCELADSIEFIVVDGNDRRCLCIRSQDIRLLQTDGHSDVLTGLESVRRSPSMTGVTPGCGPQLLRHQQTA